MLGLKQSPHSKIIYISGKSDGCAMARKESCESKLLTL